MSSRLFYAALAGFALVGGCGFLNNNKQSASPGGLHKGSANADAGALPLPATTQPVAEAPTTQPATSILSDPNAYEKAIDEYFQRKAAAAAAAARATTRPAMLVSAERHDTAPAPTPLAPHPAAKDPGIKWIEPPGARPATDAVPIHEQHTVPAPVVATNPDQGPGEPASANTRISVPDAPKVAAPPQRTLPVDSSDQLESKLARQIRDYPRDLSAQLDYQILQMLRGRQVPQFDNIANLPAEDREVLATLLDALANFRTGARDDNMMLSRKIRPLVELSDRLRSQASLRIPAIALCTRVDAFGVYEPIASDRFLAGREQSVIVYCEVENFTSRLNDRNMWQTDLTHEAVLYNDKGQRVLSEEKKRPVADLSRNRRHDFFVVRLLKLPASLPSGRYHLVVTICDQQAQRVTEASLPIQIVPER